MYTTNWVIHEYTQMEKWLPVAGFEGLYEVSSLGRVRSLDHVVRNRYSTALRHGRVLRQTPDRSGYLQVNLSTPDPWRVTVKKVHRLVAFAFLGDPPHDKSHVNHIDFTVDNNKAVNLEWCSNAENTKYSCRAGRFDGAISPKRAKKLNIEQVIAIREARASNESSESVAKRFGIAAGTVNRIIAGKIWIRA